MNFFVERGSNSRLIVSFSHVDISIRRDQSSGDTCDGSLELSDIAMNSGPANFEVSAPRNMCTQIFIAASLHTKWTSLVELFCVVSTLFAVIG